MKLAALSLSAVAALSLLAGCASSNPVQSTEEEVVARSEIELTETGDESSIQAKLFKLLDTFKDDAELGIGRGALPNSFELVGAPDGSVRRALSCRKSEMELVGVGGSGFSIREFWSCSLQGFDVNRGGGTLPPVISPWEGDKPLADKLSVLLAKGAEKGGLGVEATESVDPPCCDFPHTSTYKLASAGGSLTCELVTGGFAPIRRASCTYARTILPGE